MRRKSTEDCRLGDVDFIDREVADKLGQLEIRTIRQLADRLHRETPELQAYLDLDRRQFIALSEATESYVHTHFPDLAAAAPLPRVHHRGVAVHRLADPTRPRFHGSN